MPYNFSMTEKELSKGIQEIPSTYSAFAALVQRLGIAGVEYAIVNRNGSYLQKIMDALPEKYQSFFRQWACQLNVALIFDKEKKSIHFSGRKGAAILKSRGSEWKRENSEVLTEKDAKMLEHLASFAAGVLSAVQWDSQLKKEQKEKRDAKTTTVEDLKKSLERLRKKAEKAGVSLQELGLDLPTEVAVVEEFPESIRKIVDLLLPHANEEAVIVAATVAIASALKAANEEAKAA